MGDSTNKAKIESIFLLKLKVIFSKIFFMEFVEGTKVGPKVLRLLLVCANSAL